MASYLEQVVCVRRKKKNRKKKNTKTSAPPTTHREIHSSPATATTSRRCAMKHVPRVRPHSPASIDPGFVEISLVQLSRTVKTTNVTYTPAHRQTIKIMTPCTHPDMKRLFSLKGRKRPRSLRSLGLASLLVER